MMSGPDRLQIMLQWLMYAGPSLVMYTICLIIASTQLTRHPKPARFALAGCGVHLLSTGISLMRFVAVSAIGVTGSQTETIMMALSILEPVIDLFRGCC